MGKRSARKQPRKDPAVGDLCRIYWVDIHQGVTTDPDHMAPCPMESVGYFLGWHTAKYGNISVRYLKTSETKIGGGFMGACAFPRGVVLKVEKV